VGMSKRTPFTSLLPGNSMIVRLSLAVILFFLSSSLLLGQTAAVSPEVQALRDEVNELKARLAGLESKLEVLALSTPPAANRGVVAAVPLAPALESASSKPASLVEQASSKPAPVIAQPSRTPTPVVDEPSSTPAPVTEQASSRPAPFAFGDFTWMNGQSRQKSQPLTNSFATVNLYLDTYYGYSFNHPKDDTIVGSGAVGRNTEWQINNATIGIDTNYKNVLGKIT